MKPTEKVLALLLAIESHNAISTTSRRIYHMDGYPFHRMVVNSAEVNGLITLAPLALTDAGRAALREAEEKP